MTSAVQKASQALNERGERLGRAEEKTEDMKNSAQQFAETAHKVGPADGRGVSAGPSGSFGVGKLCFSGFPMMADPESGPPPYAVSICYLLSIKITKDSFLSLLSWLSPF